MARLDDELDLLRTKFPGAERKDLWFKIPNYPLPAGWNKTAVDVAFEVKDGYPGAPPYGIYVQAGLLFKDGKPENYTEPAGNTPPFGGTWGVFSWLPETADWRPALEVFKGANLLNWALGFAQRFKEGR